MIRNLLYALGLALLASSAVASESLSADQLTAIKKATVFILVDNGTDAGSGSGFLVKTEGTTGYVVTNHHVLSLAHGPLRRGIPRQTNIGIVFDSGLTTERLIKGEVVAEDPEHDLAMVRLRGVKDLPKPLDLSSPPRLLETMPVLICGFPFGEGLSTNRKKMPNLTIGRATISSVRSDESGNVSVVQLDGALNPGNSGGPILTTDGKVAGVAVATIRGSGIGLAIPYQKLNTMLSGTVGQPAIHASPVDANTIELRIFAPLIDPFSKVTGLAVHYRVGDAATIKGAKATIAPMTIKNGWGVTKFTVPRGSRVTFSGQFQMTRANGVAMADVPVTVELPTFGKTATAKDGKYLTGNTAPAETPTSSLGKKVATLRSLEDAPERFVGKRSTIEVYLGPDVQTQNGLTVLDVSSTPTTKVRTLDFSVGASLASQVKELGEQQRVRLTGALSAPEASRKNYNFEVEEIAILAENDEIEKVLKYEVGAVAAAPPVAVVEPAPAPADEPKQPAAAKPNGIPMWLLGVAGFLAFLLIALLVVGVRLMKHLPGKEQPGRPARKSSLQFESEDDLGASDSYTASHGSY